MGVKMTIRPLTEDSVFTCDWGRCDDETVTERYDPETRQWLAVCTRHGGQVERRPSPGRGTCPDCGKTDIALSVEGKVRAHNQAFAVRCAGSGRTPRETIEETL